MRNCSIALACLVGLLVLAQAYLFPGVVPLRPGDESRARQRGRGLATFVTSLGVLGDDVGRLISHTPHRPPVSIPRKPVPVPPVRGGPDRHLSREDAETVTKAACELKVLGEFLFAESYEERWRIASDT